MVTTNQSLQNLVEAGRVEPDQAVAVSLKLNELAQALRGRDWFTKNVGLTAAENLHQQKNGKANGQADHGEPQPGA